MRQKLTENPFGNSIVSQMTKEERLREAVRLKLANDALPLVRLAIHFQISRDTLRRRINGGQDRSQAHQSQQTLTVGQEAALVAQCKRLYGTGFPLRIDLLRGMAQQLLENTRGNDATLGSTWHLNFLKRHKELTCKYSRTLDQTRAMASDARSISHFFLLFKQICRKYKISPDNIYNFDEKGFLMDQAATARIIVPKEHKSMVNL